MSKYTLYYLDAGDEMTFTGTKKEVIKFAFYEGNNLPEGGIEAFWIVPFGVHKSKAERFKDWYRYNKSQQQKPMARKSYNPLVRYKVGAKVQRFGDDYGLRTRVLGIRLWMWLLGFFLWYKMKN